MGHGGKKVKDNVIEISCGMEERSKYSENFAKALQTKLNAEAELSSISVKGTFKDLQYKGTKSATIIDRRWIPFQIELPPLVRISSNKSLPESSNLFIKSLIDIIQLVCI